MPRHRRKLLPLCIAASLLSGVSVEAAAVGVGEIHLQSFLGAPLQAEVPLSHLGDLDAEQLKVQLGTQGDYSAMGVDYTYLHSQLKIEPIVKNGEGYVRITTREPITEPYLNFVLSLRWPQGQLVREFTVLLDPPTQSVAAIATPAHAAVIQPTAALESRASETAIPETVSTAAPRHRQHRHTSTEQARVAAPSAVGSNYVIQRGDSLWRIANRVRPAQVPVEQAMAAIQTLNPGAFINGNPNLLKEATTITLPDAGQIAAAVGATPATEVAEKATAPQAAPTTNSPAVTQLVEENSTLKTQVADLSGNVAALNQNLVQSEQRMHQLESQLNELLQQMQQQRATMATLSGTAETHSATIVQTTGSMISQVNASELRSAPKAHTPWWVHLVYWLGIGGAVTWAVREHFWPQRRLAGVAFGTAPTPSYEDRPAPMARASVSMPSKISTVEEAAGLSLDLEELPVPAAEKTVENITPSPQLLKPTDEPVDASISAGVFVAFGRFGEAEDLLRNALARAPTRIDLKLQLLDVLMQSDQPGAFDDLAAEIETEARAPEDLAELAVLRDSYRPQH